MASKIAFIVCLTLLITLTSAADQTNSLGSLLSGLGSTAIVKSLNNILSSTGSNLSQIELILENDLIGIIDSSKNTLLGTIKYASNDSNLEYQNISFTTADQIVFDKYSINTELSIIELTFHTSLYINVPYFKSNKTIMSLPFNSTASGSISVDGISFNIVVPFNMTNNNGGDAIFNLKTYSYGISIIKNVIYNLVSTDNKLNDFLNRNWIAAAKYLQPVFDALVAKWFTASQTLLNNTPLTTMIGSNTTVSTPINTTVSTNTTA